MLFVTSPQTSMMTTQAESEESLVEELVAAEADAWNKGDAHAFCTRCTEDISFTNIIGTSYYGRAAFEERSIKRLCFIRADVATADVNTELRSYAKLPSGIQTGDDGVLRTRLLLAVAPLPLRRATIREAAKSRDTALERLRTRK